MGYLASWKVLEELIADLKKKGIPIPTDIMNDLKAAKTLINVLRADPTCVDTSQKIEQYLVNVESFLVSQGQRFGNKYVEEWLKRLEKASAALDEEESETRFVTGIPRGQKWIRVAPSPELPTEKLKKLAEQSKLSHETQSDGYLLVYGEDQQIKEFVKKIATKTRLKAKK